MLATVVAVAVGALILVPSLALLFGLVLRGRFDHDATPGDLRAAEPRARTRHSWAFRLAVAAGASGVLLTLVFDRGPLLSAGIFALLCFVALGAATLGSTAAQDDLSHERRPRS